MERLQYLQRRLLQGSRQMFVCCPHAGQKKKKTECDDSEEETGRNTKSENISELERKLKRERAGSSLVGEEVVRKEGRGGNKKKTKVTKMINIQRGGRLKNTKGR